MKKDQSNSPKNQKRRKLIEKLIQAKGTIDLDIDLDILGDRKNLFQK
jgi:hypothetical protein